jgi:hypothetical protein
MFAAIDDERPRHRRPHCEVPPPRGGTGTPSSRARSRRGILAALGHDHPQRLDLVIDASVYRRS